MFSDAVVGYYPSHICTQGTKRESHSGTCDFSYSYIRVGLQIGFKLYSLKIAIGRMGKVLVVLCHY